MAVSLDLLGCEGRYLHVARFHGGATDRSFPQLISQAWIESSRERELPHSYQTVGHEGAACQLVGRR